MFGRRASADKSGRHGRTSRAGEAPVQPKRRRRARRSRMESAKERLLAKGASGDKGPASGQGEGPGRFWEQPRRGTLRDTMEKFHAKAEATKTKSQRNPPFPDDEGYGRPERGSLSEKRGVAAGDSISEEIIQLCHVISERGRPAPDGRKSITFGELFELYTKISNKVVGVLVRARKHGLVQFEGDMLYQRRDDAVVITLLKPVNEIRAKTGRSGDPASCLAERKD